MLADDDHPAFGLGLFTKLLGKICSEAGFARFEPRDIAHAMNAYYEVRP